MPDLISLPCITCVSLAPPPPLCVSVAFRLLQSSHSPSWAGSCVCLRAFLVRCGWLLCLRGFPWLACDPGVCRSPQNFNLVLFPVEKGKTQMFLLAFNRSLVSLRCCLCNHNIPGPCVTVRKVVFVGVVYANQTVKGHVCSPVLSKRERT